MKNNIKEKVVAFLLLVTAVVLLNPFDFWMSDMILMCILVFALVLFGIFASFILREGTADERDEQHRSLAGRNAFLVGATSLILGITIQAYSHNVDPWLVVTLILMVVTKVATRIWSDRNL